MTLRRKIRVDRVTVDGTPLHDAVGDYLRLLDQPDRDRDDVDAARDAFARATYAVWPVEDRRYERKVRMVGPTVSGLTLLEVVVEYLAELGNPAPDCTMRNIYRDWMRELVDHEEMS